MSRPISLNPDLSRLSLFEYLNPPQEVVAQADARVRRMGITGVPFFIFNQRLTVSGAHDPATLLGAMQQSIAPRDTDN